MSIPKDKDKVKVKPGKMPVKEKKQSRKAFLLFSVLAGASVLVSISARVIVSAFREADPPVAWINSEPVSLREFSRVLQGKRAEVLRYFSEKYRAEPDKDFWNRRFGGEIPAETAKKWAMQEIASIKVQHIMAKQMGVMQDISYAAFLKELKKENLRRENTLKRDGVIYGPTQYDENGYFSYLFSNMVLALKNRLQEEKINPGREALEDYFEAQKRSAPENIHLKNEGLIKVEKISLSFLDAAGAPDLKLKKAAEARAQEVASKLARGEKLESLAAFYNQGGALETQVFDQSTALLDSRINLKLKEEAEKLDIGKTSSVFEFNGAFLVIRCVEKKDAGFRAFEEAYDTIRKMYVEQKYKEMVEELVKKADIRINGHVYARVSLPGSF